MHNLKTVFQFGWKYLRRYWVRLFLGIVIGMLFGISNASFVWAIKTLAERLQGEPASTAAQNVASTNLVTGATNVTLSATPFPTALGATNVTSTGSVIGATDVPTNISQATAAAPPPDAAKPAASAKKSKVPKAYQIKLQAFLDRWLPRLGRDLDWRQMLGGVLFLPMLVSIRASTNYLSSYCIGWASERMINDMRLDVLSKLSSLSLDFFNRSTTGDLLTRINGDTAALLRCLRLGAADLVKESISLVSLFVFLMSINWKLTMFGMGFVPFCLFPLLVLARKVRRAAKGARGGEIVQTSQLVELVGGIRIVKAYLLEGQQIARYRSLSREMVRIGMRALRAKELTTPAVELVSMLGLGVLLVFIFKTKVGLGDFAAFLAGMMMFLMPLKKLAGVHILFEQAAPGVERLVQILNMEPTVKEPVNPKPLGTFKSALAFEKVSFAYAQRPVIRELSLTIPRGMKLGIAGPSGSGKSTLVNLLFRFYDPTKGAIKIDGVDLRDLTFKDLREQLALVSQEVILFDQTVAENIRAGRADATQADIEAAAHAAYAHDFIMQLPQGYKTRVGERGVTLSGGQRQRIAIARAFIRNAPILVLDEATASLDSEAEAEVQHAIDHISENRTVVCVAHRLSTLANCDHIMVMAEGRIIEQGGFQKLLRAGGTFTAMARRQGIFAKE